MRIAFHVHSDWSYDGTLPLEEIARRFAQRRYDAVLLCEHCRTFDESRWQEYQDACAAVVDGALLIPGIEYSDPDNTVHLPTWGLSNFAGAEVASEGVLDAVRAAGALCVLAHPARKNAWKRLQPAWLDALSGYEYWNRKTDGFAPSRAAHVFAETRLHRFIALDYHSDRQRAPFVLNVDINSLASDMPRNDRSKGVLEALKSGNFHSRVAGTSLEVAASSIFRPLLSSAEGLKRIIRQRDRS